jgi:hypothetical protein
MTTFVAPPAAGPALAPGEILGMEVAERFVARRGGRVPAAVVPAAVVLAAADSALAACGRWTTIATTST